MTEPSYPLYTFRKMSLVLGGKMCGFQGNFRGQRHALEKRQSAGSGRGAGTGAGKGSFILAFKRNDACSTQDYSHGIYCSQDELGARIPLRSPSVPACPLRHECPDEPDEGHADPRALAFLSRMQLPLRCSVFSFFFFCGHVSFS